MDTISFSLVTMISSKKLWISLTDFDGETLKTFYQNLFGQAPEIEIPNIYAEFNLPGLKLGLFKPKTNHLQEFTAPSSGGMSLCLEVENLEEAIAQLTQLGYPPTTSIQTVSHGRELYSYDPNGNRIILYEPFLNRNL
jgi:predicted enzyme related to lactoylglutathione lyase